MTYNMRDRARLGIHPGRRPPAGRPKLRAAVGLLVSIAPSIVGCRTGGGTSSTCCTTPNGGGRATLAYTIRYHQETSPATLSVQLDAAGLPASNGPLVVRLPNWGEWTSASYAYLRALRVDGRALTNDSTGVSPVPRELLADGRLTISYDLVVQPLGAPEQASRPLLPYRTDTYAFAFVTNTLVRITADGAPIDAGVTVRVDAAPDQQVFTGWNGFSVGTQTAAAPATLTTGNGILAIGRSFERFASTIDGTPLEVVQAAPGPDATMAVVEAARAVMTSATRATGRGPWGPVRIFIEAARGSGTHTDFGLVFSRSPAGVPLLPLPEGFTELLAHELLHDWLGSHLVGDVSVVWFTEGFTDYLANWHGTAAGLFTRDRFADRILSFEREARNWSSLGRIAFAQPDVNWRDGDGPHERMAYKGGALLAFVLDVELRRRGQSVSAIIRELLASGSREYALADIRNAMIKLGLSDLYERAIAGTQVPEARALLLDMGFVETIQQAGLTYLGIEARYDGPADAIDVVPAIVTAIDSAGPAAKVGVRPGDRIVGYGERRGDPPQLGPSAPRRFLFGINVIPSGARSVKLDILRDGRPTQIEVAPVRMAGGQRTSMRWNPERRTDFFDPPRL
jgi:hypothetical protein